MDISNFLHAMVLSQRAQEVSNGEQVTLGELILKLEACDKDLPVYLDNTPHRPTGLCSWRGSYNELAIQYEGAGVCYEQPKAECTKDQFGDHDYDCKCGGADGISTELPQEPKVSDMLMLLNIVKGKYFIGWKGGDFTMGKCTPIWIANDGCSGGYTGKCQYLLNVVGGKDRVTLVTKNDSN